MLHASVRGLAMSILCVAACGAPAVADEEAEPSAAAATVPSARLIAWYPFSGNANDASGNGNHGTVHGATLAADRFGTPNSAYSFDGVNDYIELPNEWRFDLRGFTIALWAKPADIGPNPPGTFAYYRSLVMKGPQYGNFRLDHLHFGGASYYFGSYLHSTADTIYTGFNEYAAPIYLGQFSQIAVTNDGTTLKMYINGNLRSTFTPFSPPVYNNSNVRIGMSETTNANLQPFHGVLDDVRFYNYALTSAQVAALP